MRQSIHLFLAVAFLVFAAGLSLAAAPPPGGVDKGDHLGTSKAEIRKSLEAKGYDVKEFDRERGLIEVEAKIGGVLYEILVDPKTGKVEKWEEDD